MKESPMLKRIAKFERRERWIQRFEGLKEIGKAVIVFAIIIFWIIIAGLCTPPV